MRTGYRTSWGCYPGHKQREHRITSSDDAIDALQTISGQYGTTLPFGNGRSYGDSCLATSNQVIGVGGLKRFIAADWEAGLLTVEAGLLFDEILSVILPKGWFLPVTPGTKHLTIGGAIANDVHGKNHHVRGCFGEHVDAFGLVRSDGEELICSPDANQEYFQATIGGLGVTGVVTWARLRLMPVKSAMMDVDTIPFESVPDFVAKSKALEPDYEYLIGWVDCSAPGNRLGRGILIAGNHAADGELNYNQRFRLSVPFTPPMSLVNRVSLPLVNKLYYHWHKRQSGQSQVDYDSYFYPLDNIRNWNRAYGPRGFQQFQCVLPSTTAESALEDLLRVIAKSGTGSFLSAMKCCGPSKSPGLLSFPMEGISLGLDFPQLKRGNHQLFEQMDGIVREAGGRLYPAKDAHMSGADFRTAYPRWTEVEALRDPALLSHFWERVIS